MSASDQNQAVDNASVAWKALVRRSIEAWNPRHRYFLLARDTLQGFNDLDDFLASDFGNTTTPMFWMFQRREAFLSQKRMAKWSRDRLDDYVIFPAHTGFVTRAEHFFVSHFWQTKTDPDPDGVYLRLHQNELGPQHWSYIWVDWTCLPQHPRTSYEEYYFLRGLGSMPAIIRNCGFTWFYPDFEPRMWILYEISECALTQEIPLAPTPDIELFSKHVREMAKYGVRPTLEKHGYKCSDERDTAFLISSMEILFLMRTLDLDLDNVRHVMNRLTWGRLTSNFLLQTSEGLIQISRYEGFLIFKGRRYSFTPFPDWIKCQWPPRASSKLGKMESEKGQRGQLQATKSSKTFLVFALPAVLVAAAVLLRWLGM